MFWDCMGKDNCTKKTRRGGKAYTVCYTVAKSVEVCLT